VIIVLTFFRGTSPEQCVGLKVLQLILKTLGCWSTDGNWQVKCGATLNSENVTNKDKCITVKQALTKHGTCRHKNSIYYKKFNLK